MLGLFLVSPLFLFLPFLVCAKIPPDLFYLISALAKQKCCFSSANNIEGVIWYYITFFKFSRINFLKSFCYRITYSIFWELLYHHIYVKNALEQIVKDRTVLEVVLVPDESPENEAHKQLKLCYICQKRNSHLVHVVGVVNDQN